MGPVKVTIDANGQQKWECQKCHSCFGKKFDFTEHQYNHRLEEEEKRKKTCKECEMYFHSEEAFDDHRKRSGHGVEKRVLDKNGILRYPCELCPSMFSTKFYLEKHLEIHARGKAGVGKFGCDLCEMKFTKKIFLECHMIDDHNGVEKERGAIKKRIGPRLESCTSSSGCSSEYLETTSEEDEEVFGGTMGVEGRMDGPLPAKVQRLQKEMRAKIGTDQDTFEEQESRV